MKLMLLPRIAPLLLTLGLLSSRPAFAQSSAQAESLFRDGLELMEIGNYEKACNLFAVAPQGSGRELALNAHLPGSGLSGLSLRGRF